MDCGTDAAVGRTEHGPRQDSAFATVDEVENGGVIDFADDQQMLRRQTLAEEFYDALGLIDDENRPFFVSDEAALYDIQMEDDDFVVAAVQHHYGITCGFPKTSSVRSDSYGQSRRTTAWPLLAQMHIARRAFIPARPRPALKISATTL